MNLPGFRYLIDERSRTISFIFDDGREFDADLGKADYYQKEFYSSFRSPYKQISLQEFIIQRFVEDNLFDQYEVVKDEIKLLPLNNETSSNI